MNEEAPQSTKSTQSKREQSDSVSGQNYNLNAEKIVGFIGKWSKRLMPEQAPQDEIPPSPKPKFSFVLFFLKLLPWLTLAAYFISLWWDFQGIPAPVISFGADKIEIDTLMRMMAACGLVGFGTNWLAIKMLFYPRKKRPLLGQGLIPSRKDRIVLRLGESISKEIINSELILAQIRNSGLITRHREKLTASVKDLLAHPEFIDDLMDVTKHYMEGFLRSQGMQEQLRDIVESIDFENMEGLEGGLVRLYRLFKGNKDITNQLLNSLQKLSFRVEDYQDNLLKHLNSVPRLLEEKGDRLEDFALGALVFLVEQVNVKKVITENLHGFDEIRLERLLMRSTSDQLQYIQYLGCLFGILGALFIWRPLESFLIFGGLAGLIYGLDHVLFNLKQKNKKKEKEKTKKKNSKNDSNKDVKTEEQKKKVG